MTDLAATPSLNLKPGERSEYFDSDVPCSECGTYTAYYWRSKKAPHRLGIVCVGCDSAWMDDTADGARLARRGDADA